MNKRIIGFEKELFASEYLQRNGLVILDKNFYTPTGEIDIVAKDEDYIVFVEVKYRKTLNYGNPLESIGKSKISKIVKASRYYLYKNHYSTEVLVRFDCIGILGKEITWIKNAFEAF